MERLTCKQHNSDGYTISCSNACRGGDCGDCAEFGKIIDRLAAYEDTGLKPEEVCKVRADIDAGYMKSIARTYGIDITRMKEIAAADREGRVVVLPEVRYCERYGWQNITWDSKYGICAGSHNTREEAEEALRRDENGNC